MGYNDRLWKSTCAHCGKTWSWLAKSPPNSSGHWTCASCKKGNLCHALPDWPNVPRTLYLGADNKNLLQVYPIPPGYSSGHDWALPYSTRSFIFQANRTLRDCGWYTPECQGEVLGERVFSDNCLENDVPYYPDTPRPRCHLLAGWTIGEKTCPLWEKLAALCQTPAEQRFLHAYFGFVRDRTFPALLPQPRLGIAERRRPDFAVFVPLSYWKYKWYAIQLDAAHSDRQEKADAVRDAEISCHGYQVLSLRPEAKGYYEELKKLVERIEFDMGQAESRRWEVAIEVESEGR